MIRTYQTIYKAPGNKHNFEVYKPDTGIKFYVRKVSKKNDKHVGSDKSFPTENLAKQAANRYAANEGIKLI